MPRTGAAMKKETKRPMSDKEYMERYKKATPEEAHQLNLQKLNEDIKAAGFNKKQVKAMMELVTYMKTMG